MGCDSPCHQRGAFQSAFLLYIKVGKGGELIAGLKPPICEDIRTGPEELVLDLKLLQQALGLNHSLEQPGEHVD